MTVAGNRLGDVWERWARAWYALFAVVCAGAFVLAWLQTPSSAHIPLIILTVLLAVWYALSAQLPPLSDWGYAGYFAVGWLLWYALVGYSPAYFLILSSLFPQVFMLTKLPRSAGFALTLNVLVLLHLRAINSDLIVTWMLLTLIAWVGGVLLAYYITDIIRQSRERQELIDRLEAAQTRIAEIERQVGIADERQRLAGELHDTIAQGLIGIVTHLEAAGAAPDEAARYIDGAKALARENLSEVRRFIWELRPPALAGQVFEDGLRGMINRWSIMRQVSVELVITGTPCTLPEEQQLALLRVSQEALANIGKHAQARRVTLTLSYVPGAVILDVNDDGIGFAAAEHGNGYGLVNMRRRVEALGGTLVIESAPGAGTTIVAELPLRVEEGLHGPAPVDRG